MLSNEKYIGNVRLLDSVTDDVEYLVKENYPRIISSNIFNKVHAEKKQSNVIKEEGEAVRKDKNLDGKQRDNKLWRYYNIRNHDNSSY